MGIFLFLAAIATIAAQAGAPALAPAPAGPPPLAPCNFAPDVTVRIACTVNCMDTYKGAAKAEADKLHVKVEFLTLKDNAKVDLAHPEKSFDALISPGGLDILPEYFLTQPPDTPEKISLRGRMRKEFYDQGLGSTNADAKLRDSFEYAFANRYLTDDHYKKIPFLGTCYGMQIMAAAVGLPLYVDLQTDLGLGARRKVADSIFITDASSVISRTLASNFSGEKNHHQAIDYSYWEEHRSEMPNVKITANSNDAKIAEVMELKNRPFMGTQFHAERSEDATRSGIYKWLLGEACKGMRARGPASKPPVPGPSH